MVFWSGLLLYHVCGFKHYFDVCVLEKVGDFPDYGAVVGEYGPFFVSISFVLVGFVLYLLFQFLYEMQGEIVVFGYGEDFLPFCFLSFCSEWW